MPGFRETRVDLRNLVESHGGPQKGGPIVARKIVEDVLTREANDAKAGITGTDHIGDFFRANNLKEMFEAFVGRDIRPEDFGFTEAVNSSIFPNLTGTLLSRAVVKAYMSMPTIWQDLCEVMQSNRKVENVPGVEVANSTPQQVSEQMAPEAATMSEKLRTATNILKGIRIPVTEEAVFFDQTGLVLKNARTIGENMVRDKEKRIVEGVSGQSQTVFDGGILYENAQSNIQTDTNTSISQDEFKAYVSTLRQALNDRTDDAGQKIQIPGPWTLLVPPELEEIAFALLNSSQVAGSANNDVNYYKGRYMLRSSNYLTNAKDFWLGNFKAQFQWNEVWPFQTRVHPADVLNRILAQTVVYEYGEIMATDYRYVEMYDIA